MAATVNLSVDQGATWSQSIQWKTGAPAVAVDLTGYTARAQVRRTAAAEVLEAEPTCTITAATGTTTLSLTAAQTAAITAGRYVYDLELVSAGGLVTRLCQGAFVVSAEVTR